MLNLRSYRDFVYVDCWVISMASSCICAQKNDAPNSAGVLEFVGTAAAHAGLPGLWKISVTDSDIAQIWQLAMVCHIFWGAYCEDWHQNIFNIDYWLYLEYLAMVWQCEFFIVGKLLIFTCLVFRWSLFRRMLQLQVEYLTIQAETSFSAYIEFSRAFRCAMSHLRKNAQATNIINHV